MKSSQMREKICAAAEKAAARLDYEVVEVEILRKEPARIIITVYHADGVDIDDCAEISRDVDEQIENEDLFPGAYTLEVQSPGLDRPIRSRDDYRRNLGKKVEVRLYKKLENKKDFVGILADYGEDTVDIREEDGRIVTLDSKSISLMRQVIEF
ncbi:Ribosome maturation factor RimP [Aedoeadaptatus ivorii]|uniref:Ribosome maturation factor RimP n=1 Tax=Aedoeadaptatus ivorii TaxID=54006 RepID=A0A448V1M5_9FIRM|nr:ribosome maturation factor RimP [Peptoniphilus ivorii]MDQ0507810.1 ribosome maturation factor RimP [Peptoniphilus ivorii]VEJ35637.1 Ribosome maturation factor RimP [Peptoniphilus ivorii]